MKAVLSILLIALAEMGQMSPPVVSSDPHIQIIPYDPARVVSLDVSTGYAVVVELADDERIENIVVGDSGSWQVVANKRGNHLIIKSSGSIAPTDLVVSTDARRYVFLLKPSSSSDAATFVVRFYYPQERDPLVAAGDAKALGGTYKLRGTKALFPVAISDDGKRTTLKWPHDVPLPAIFASDEEGKEAIVNGRMVAGSFIVEGVSPRYIFRLGEAQAIAIRHVIKASRR